MRLGRFAFLRCMRPRFQIPWMIWGMIVKAIKSSVPTSEQARFVVILEDEAAWKTVTHYTLARRPLCLVGGGCSAGDASTCCFNAALAGLSNWRC